MCNALVPKVFSTYDGFTSRYCDQKPSYIRGTKFDVSGCSNSRELQLLLGEMLMIRRLKADTLRDLPAKERLCTYVDPDPSMQAVLHEAHAKYVDLKQQFSRAHTEVDRAKLKSLVDVQMNHLWLVTGTCKIKGIRAEVRSLLQLALKQRIDAEALDAHYKSSMDAVGFGSAVEHDCIAPAGHISDAFPLVSDCGVPGPKKSYSASAKLMKLEDDEVVFIGTATKSSANSKNVPRDERIHTIGSFNSVLAKSSNAMLSESESENLIDSDEEGNVSKQKGKLLRNRSVPKKLTDSNGANCSASCSQPCLVHFRLSPDDDEDLDNSENDLSYAGSDNETDSNGLGNVPHKRKFDKSFARSQKRTISGRDQTEVAQNGPNTDLRSGGGSQESESDWADVFLPNKTVNVKKGAKLERSSEDENEEDSDDEDDFTFTKSKHGSKSRAIRQKKATHNKNSTKAKSESCKVSQYRGLGQKILIFAHHKVVMDSIDDLLHEEGVQFVRIDGSTSMASRTKLVETFQTDDDTLVALLSIKVCGTGMNLTRANAALFAELDWTPGQMQQAEDRIHRLGQRR
jgi:hypothetical protein